MKQSQLIRILLRNPTLLKEIFTTCPEDRPLIAQFCGNDPDEMVKAAELV